MINYISNCIFYIDGLNLFKCYFQENIKIIRITNDQLLLTFFYILSQSFTSDFTHNTAVRKWSARPLSSLHRLPDSPQDCHPPRVVEGSTWRWYLEGARQGIPFFGAPMLKGWRRVVHCCCHLFFCSRWERTNFFCHELFFVWMDFNYFCWHFDTRWFYLPLQFCFVILLYFFMFHLVLM